VCVKNARLRMDTLLQSFIRKQFDNFCILHVPVLTENTCLDHVCTTAAATGSLQIVKC